MAFFDSINSNFLFENQADIKIENYIQSLNSTSAYVLLTPTFNSRIQILTQFIIQYLITNSKLQLQIYNTDQFSVQSNKFPTLKSKVKFWHAYIENTKQYSLHPEYSWLFTFLERIWKMINFSYCGSLIMHATPPLVIQACVPFAISWRATTRCPKYFSTQRKRVPPWGSYYFCYLCWG